MSDGRFIWPEHVIMTNIFSGSDRSMLSAVFNMDYALSLLLRDHHSDLKNWDETIAWHICAFGWVDILKRFARSTVINWSCMTGLTRNSFVFFDRVFHAIYMSDIYCSRGYHQTDTSRPISVSFTSRMSAVMSSILPIFYRSNFKSRPIRAL